jgi:excisionase family DNA binding protein
MPHVAKQKKRRALRTSSSEVLDLAAAAKFLRLPAKTVERLVAEQGLPGRQIGKEWRFLRAAIERWLEPRGRTKRSVLDQAGVLKDDPTYDDYRKIIEENRRRWNEEVA